MSSSTTNVSSNRGISSVKIKRAAADHADVPVPANDRLSTAVSTAPQKGGEGGTASLDGDARLAAGAGRPPKGGEGGDRPLPASPPSNAEFVATVFREVPAGAVPVVCSKAGDPANGGWPAEAAAHVDRQCPADRNNYVACSAFQPDGDGSVKARKEAFEAFYALVLDDVGTKVPRDRLAGIDATWEVETSPGNSQVGFRLAEPMRDLAAVERLQNAVAAAGLSDPGAKGAARWIRLPRAVNGKAKYRDDRGQPFACRTVNWAPEVAYTTAELVVALGVNLAPTAVAVVSPAPPVAVAASRLFGGDGIWTPAPFENPVLSALRDRGLHKRQIAPGRHDVTCPWVIEHTDGADSGTAYFEPDVDHPAGGFKCQHSHGDRYRVSDLLDFLGVKEDAARGKASVLVVPGEMHRVVRGAEKVLAAAGGFYQMGGAIVRIRVDPATGDAATDPLNDAQLASALSQASDWYGLKAQQDGKPSVRTRTDPKTSVVQALSRSGDYRFLPPLTGIARQPFFRDDGTLVAVGGYDAASGRFGAFDGAAFPMSEATENAARAALATLEPLLREFRFADEADRSAAYAAILTAAVRPGLPAAPAFNITASAPGSGKSYLAKLVASFASAGQPMNLSYPTTGEEASKLVLATLATSPAVINFDDMQSQWMAHGAINRMLTSETVTDRVLGSSRTMTVGTRCMVMGTGNNVGPVRDMVRRVVTVRLHHTSATPALVSYGDDPVAAVAADRGRYVAAALTIVAAYREAGAPDMGLPSIATYEAWSGTVRSSLVWLGLPDPATSLIAQLEHDPDQAVLGAILRAWHKAFGDTPVPVRKVVEEAFDHDALQEALEDAPVMDRDVVNRSRLGWYLKHNVNRVVDGLELQRVERANRTAWRVVRVAEPADAG